MPLGEIIAEAVGEVVIYGVTYWTGYAFLSAVSLGQLEMAPLSTFSEKNKEKKKWYQADWSIWLRQNGKKKALRAELVVLTGLALWIVAGIAIFLAISTKGANQSHGGNGFQPSPHADDLQKKWKQFSR